MKARERVETVLNHELVDRCPMQISFTPEFASRLREDMEHQGGVAHNTHVGGNTYKLERVLGQDMLLTSIGRANSYFSDVQAFIDEWGIWWEIQPYETIIDAGYYTEIADHLFVDESAVNSFDPPDPNRPDLYFDANRIIVDWFEKVYLIWM